MDGDIIPRSIVLERAKRAAESGQPLVPQSFPWPVGTAAGQLFHAEVLAQQALRAASRRVAESSHA